MSNAAEKIAERALPEVLAVVFRAGGWKAVQGLTKTYGGTKLRVPRMKVGDHHPLTVACGRAAADALVENYGSAPALDVPMGGHALKLLLVRDHADMPINQLCRLLGCGYRWAWRLRKMADGSIKGGRRGPGRPKPPRDPRQTDILDFIR